MEHLHGGCCIHDTGTARTSNNNLELQQISDTLTKRIKKHGQITKDDSKCLKLLCDIAECQYTSAAQSREAVLDDFIEKAEHLAQTIPDFNRMDYIHLLKAELRQQTKERER
jgi:hypothetical protein